MPAAIHGGVSFTTSKADQRCDEFDPGAAMQRGGRAVSGLQISQLPITKRQPLRGEHRVIDFLLDDLPPSEYSRDYS